MASPFDDDWVPPQVQQPELIDLRAVAYGPRGYKLKNKEKFAAGLVGSEKMEIDSKKENPLRLGRGKVVLVFGASLESGM